uniref:Uncharacterized protein n=1 Tax=Timema monikensis TaxID=170555 RepID=A0A7R9E203_9NEOP|nr:unnamed protein product [Timema monikensis]
MQPPKSRHVTTFLFWFFGKRVESFVIDQAESDEEGRLESSKFLLSPEDAEHSVDPETQARLEALLEAAGIGKLSTADGKHLADPEVLRRLTSSVSCALDEAAAALTRMRSDNPRPQPETRSLVEACTDGDVPTVRKLLTEGRSVHETTEEGESLLSLACSAGYYELAQVLLAMHANVEDRGIKEDCTPLMEAASAGHVDIVRLLIMHGADVNAQSSTACFALPRCMKLLPLLSTQDFVVVLVQVLLRMTRQQFLPLHVDSPPRFNYRRADWPRFQDRLARAIFPAAPILDVAKLDRKANLFALTLLGAATSSIPVRRPPLLGPPLPLSILDEMQLCDRARALWQRSHILRAREVYRVFRSRCRRLIRRWRAEASRSRHRGSLLVAPSDGDASQARSNPGAARVWRRGVRRLGLSGGLGGAFEASFAQRPGSRARNPDPPAVELPDHPFLPQVKRTLSLPRPSTGHPPRAFVGPGEV